MTTTTEAEPKPKRHRRQGPPNIPCPDCHKLAGAQDEGEVEDYEASVTGDIDSAEVSIDGGSLILSSACCGSQWKQYDLGSNGYSKTLDHACPVAAERDALQQEWDEHIAEDGPCDSADDVPCKTTDKGILIATCSAGSDIKERLDAVMERINSDAEEWEMEAEGDPEPYERRQTTARSRKTGKVTSIKNSSYAKTFRGFTVTVTVKHGLCGESEDLSFDEGDIEAQAGDAEPV